MAASVTSPHSHIVGIHKIQRIDLAIKVCGVVALILFALTIVFIGLAQAGYVHPVTPLGTFVGVIPALCLIKAIDCCRRNVAERHGINLEQYDAIQHREWREKRKDDGEGESSDSEVSSSVSR